MHNHLRHSLVAQILDCIVDAHDRHTMLLAALVCAVGIYASIAIARHAARSSGAVRIRWGSTSVLSSGCTAWATHFIVLLAYQPNMRVAFEPVLTAISLTCAVVGIGGGVVVSLSSRRGPRQFAAGVIIGVGVAALHYVGQSAYLVQGTIRWDLTLVIPSIIVSLPIFGFSMMAIASRNRTWQTCAAPLMLLGIAILHFCGMAAMTLQQDPSIEFPSDAVAPQTITPIVAGISLALIALAFLGWRFDLAATARIRQDRKRLRDLADVALEGLLITQNNIIIAANRSIERLSGLKQDDLTGSEVSRLLPALELTTLLENEEREANLIGVDGIIVPVRVLRSTVPLGHSVQTVIAVRDQRERLRTEEKMRRLAFADPLTGLHNRTKFTELLERHTCTERRTDQGLAILLIDLDSFKIVNDTLGHAVGDAVLQDVSIRLSTLVKDRGIVARLGGDEFVVMLTGDVSDVSAFDIASKVVEQLGARPFDIDGRTIHIGASVGLALFPEDGGDPSSLLRNADLAMYLAKSEGKGTVRRFEKILHERLQERQSLEAGLRIALSSGQLEVHYQPLVDAASGRITSAEALVRWRHPSLGLIAPATFISLAEETGLIVPLGTFVLKTACAEAATWPPEIGLAVNLSPAQFHDKSIASIVASAIEDAHLLPQRLEVEVTEGVLLADTGATLETLNRLRSMGVRVSMDDFGTGYSSLSYLRRFPFDRLKIDRSFVRGIPSDAESVAIARAIITMSTCLGLLVTVEGVETAEQYAFAVSEGCTSIQGYYISRPMRAEAFAAFLIAWNNQAPPNPSTGRKIAEKSIVLHHSDLRSVLNW
ncbi:MULTISPECIES: EAL domain-containing protein [unclassified Caballeronia]|uniref:putative bifunctional diguanylate cyclase/phosphodiesterase n=1 Tax=unclassified Caballeronia TaxID=2646786 RepID=UPI00285F58A0|nr:MULTISPECIES: EAL domain-containing protein [unclassified Caballeronia]MDR5777065.1 EAL domain-containing protein [Caballeronia sp. LZ002]MDR5852491.1 EAL domain-containing protein [Caballeronia sp. LZ003]